MEKKTAVKAAADKPVTSFDQLVADAEFRVIGCPWCENGTHRVKVVSFEQHAKCAGICRFARFRRLDRGTCGMNGIGECNMAAQRKTPRLFFS